LVVAYGRRGANVAIAEAVDLVFVVGPEAGYTGCLNAASRATMTSWGYGRTRAWARKVSVPAVKATAG